MDEPPQYPLEFPHTPQFTEATFLPSPAYGEALEFLADTGNWPRHRLALWGGRGVGKTHLLHIWARNHGAGILSATALDRPVWPEGPLAVDDLDRVASEPALLYLLNAASETGHPLLFTSRVAPARLRAGLPDLQSRLRSITSVEIGRLDDTFLATLLSRLISDRQLPVAVGLQSWLLARLPRTPGAIQDAVTRLDRAAFAAGSRVTRQLAAHALADVLDGESGHSVS
ncbi:MAG: chromosomal replication initiator DnaA [Acetobacteraceae bacterium]|nr:chromosomal replication initiator DnaA [Acetobacteraceae bacterium]